MAGLYVPRRGFGTRVKDEAYGEKRSLGSGPRMGGPGFDDAERRNAETLIDLALAEDLGQPGDMTASLTIPVEARGSARLASRSEGVISGLPVVALLAERFELAFQAVEGCEDGARVTGGQGFA